MLNARGDNDAIWAHVGREHVASCHSEDYKWDCNFVHASSNERNLLPLEPCHVRRQFLLAAGDVALAQLDYNIIIN